MKRYLALVLVVVLIFSSMTFPAFAQKASEGETIVLTDANSGVTEEYDVINLMMGGVDVIMDVPAILYHGRTLVPVGFVKDHLGAEVGWDQDKQEVKIMYKSDEIVLTIDSEIAYVNGEATVLPDGVPAKLLGYGDTYRTMVPVTFVTEQFGLERAWIAETKTVSINKPVQTLTAIDYISDQKYKELRLKTTGDVEVTSYFLRGSEVGGSDKIIIELHNTIFDLTDKSDVNNNGMYIMDVYKNGVSQIYGIQSETNPYKTRIEVNLDSPRGYDMWYDESTNEVVFQFVNSVHEISPETVYNAEAIVIETAESPAYNVMPMGDQLYVDIMNSKLKLNDGEAGIIHTDHKNVEGISYYQYEPGYSDDIYDYDDLVTRVVIDLDRPMTYDEIYVESVGTELYVFVAGKALNGLDYVKNSISTAKLDITLNYAASYDSNYNENSNTLTLTVPKSAAALDEFNVKIDDNIVKSIKVSTSGSDYVVKVALEDGTKPVSSNKDGVNKISYAFVNEDLENSAYRDTLIVIDAGHGGHDSGATGAISYEKDIALNASKMLKKELEALGFKTYMTRDTDHYVGLYDRANIANELNADLFISMHINASTNHNASGVEVLYYPTAANENHDLAKAIQDSMVSQMNVIDRGVIERPNLVVTRETNMPSVIVELGFISNPEEERSLNNDNYLSRIVNSVLEGILEFLNF